MQQLTRTRRLFLPFAIVCLGSALTSFPALQAADAGGSDWVYCMTECPNLVEFCEPRGGHELAYCEYTGCWGPNTQQWYLWKVQC